MKVTLKAARINVGMTQAEAAKSIGVSRETLVNWESGKSFPAVSKIPEIERTYRVNYDQINFLP